MIYLDHNATTPIDVRVQEAMSPYLQTFFGNPSSLYRLGRLARSAIDTAREQLAALVDVSPTQVIFTSGGTEANNLALYNIPTQASVAVSATEHPSIAEPVQTRQSFFRHLSWIPVNSNGEIKKSMLDRFEFQRDDFVSIMLANNETGMVQDIGELAEYLRNRGVIFHTDAVQALGKIPVSFPALGVDMMSLSSHKIYGPKGCGALVVGKEFHLRPMLLGGGQENSYRSGTENVAAIVGFGKAAELAKIELSDRRQKLLSLREHLEQALSKIPGIVFFSHDAERLPNTVQVSISGIDGEMLLMQLDRHNIALSSGSACASAGGKPSPVLTAMGIDPVIAKGAVRISLGKDNSERDIDEFISVLKSLLD